jgi:enoyl-CoA hydratase/carnithine racemase
MRAQSRSKSLLRLKTLGARLIAQATGAAVAGGIERVTAASFRPPAGINSV